MSSEQALSAEQVELLRRLPCQIQVGAPFDPVVGSLMKLGLAVRFSWVHGTAIGNYETTQAGDTLLATIDAAREDERRRIAATVREAANPYMEEGRMLHIRKFNGVASTDEDSGRSFAAAYAIEALASQLEAAAATTPDRGE